MNIPAFIALPLRAVFILGFLIFVAVGFVVAIIADACTWFYRTVTET